MNTISTLYRLRQRLNLDTAETGDDPRLLAALQAASAQIERGADRYFTPRQAAIRHSVTASRELLLDDDLLELTALTNGDDSAISPNDVLYLPDSPPYSVLWLINSQSFVWLDTPLNAVSVAGIWGWHDNWAAAWRDSGDTVQNNPLSSSATAITVTDADGADAAGAIPRFQVGHLLKIESEYLRVLAVNTATNVLTVERGANNTTPAAHVQTTAISTYQPPADIEALALRWAAWLYREPEMRGGEPAHLRAALSPLRRPVVT